MTDTVYCSFCIKSQHEVRQLFAAPSAWICDECIDHCALIIAGARKEAHERLAATLGINPDGTLPNRAASSPRSADTAGPVAAADRGGAGLSRGEG